MNKIPFIKSLSVAINGLINAFKIERNIKIQVFIALIVLFVSYILNLNQNEICIVLLSIALVISLELVNTSIEKTMDLYSIENNNKIKLVKDISASSVLLASVFTFIIGLIIFLPKCLKFIKTWN